MEQTLGGDMAEAILTFKRPSLTRAREPVPDHITEELVAALNRYLFRHPGVADWVDMKEALKMTFYIVEDDEMEHAVDE